MDHTIPIMHFQVMIFHFRRNTWHTTMLFPDFQAPYPRSNKSDTGGLPYYYKEGIVAIALT